MQIDQLQQLNIFINERPVLFAVIMLWTIIWKGLSLWTASKENKRLWFVLLLILNTMGLLDIIYIFFVAKKKWADIKNIFSSSTQNTL